MVPNQLAELKEIQLWSANASVRAFEHDVGLFDGRAEKTPWCFHVGCKYIIIKCTLLWIEKKSYFPNANHLPTPCIFFFVCILSLCILYVFDLQRHCFLVDFLLGVTIVALVHGIQNAKKNTHAVFGFRLLWRIFKASSSFFPFHFSFAPPSTYSIIFVFSSNPPLCWRWAVEVSIFWSGVFDVVCHYQIAARRVLWSFNICYMWTAH